MPRNLAFATLLVAVFLVSLAALACGDDDAPDVADDTPTPAPTESPTNATPFVPDPSDPCPRPAGREISGLVALLGFGNPELDEGQSVPLGQPVRMTLRVINCSDGELERSYAGEQEHDFVVRTAGGDTVWRWSDGQEFSTDGSTVTFDPGQEVTYEASWAQIDSAGQAVAPGDYDIIGESLACDASLRNCATRAAATITIAP